MYNNINYKITEHEVYLKKFRQCQLFIYLDFLDGFIVLI